MGLSEEEVRMNETELEDFVITMFAKLDEHSEKGRKFRDQEFGWLMSRMLEEFQELQEALVALRADPTPENRLNVQKECGDVANFAMMIHVNSKDKEK